MNMLNFVDKPHAISKKLMRQYFEGAINNTPSLKANTPLGAMEINGEFSHYINSETDTMWLGFPLGMRYSERIARAAGGADERSNTQSTLNTQ